MRVAMLMILSWQKFADVQPHVCADEAARKRSVGGSRLRRENSFYRNIITGIYCQDTIPLRIPCSPCLRRQAVEYIVLRVYYNRIGIVCVRPGKRDPIRSVKAARWIR